MGKSTINGSFSITMLNYQRLYQLSVYHGVPGLCWAMVVRDRHGRHSFSFHGHRPSCCEIWSSSAASGLNTFDSLSWRTIPLEKWLVIGAISAIYKWAILPSRLMKSYQDYWGVFRAIFHHLLILAQRDPPSRINASGFLPNMCRCERPTAATTTGHNASYTHFESIAMMVGMAFIKW